MSRETLEKTFQAFIENAEQVFHRESGRREDHESRGMRVLMSKAARLRSCAEAVEQHKSFEVLLQETVTHVIPEDEDGYPWFFWPLYYCGGLDDLFDYSLFYFDEDATGEYWRAAISNFFRNSGFYNRLFKGEDFDPDALYRRYRSAFERDTVTLWHIVPISCLPPSDLSMQFEGFRIMQGGELSDILCGDVRAAFYPYRWAEVNLIAIQDIGCLAIPESIPGHRTAGFSGTSPPLTAMLKPRGRP